MKSLELLCMGCMKIKPQKGKCPYCHFDLGKYQSQMVEEKSHYLSPQTILNGKYLIGKVLGEGGFGITYIGWNLQLEIPIAIKEFFPAGFAIRDIEKSTKISVFSGNKGQFYLNQKEKFINEARLLAKLDNLKGIVSVKDFFEENNTAYIVMEYLDGEDFRSFLKRNGGKLSPESVFAIMKPIMEALMEIHSKGLIHRDISPDNIRITENSEVKLIDFGAAREASSGDKSLSILLKPGYAPEEQYRTQGAQGPWTDIYALCATMYRAITGQKPIEALDRMAGTPLKTPSQLGISIKPKHEFALMKGLAVLSDDRWQTVNDLYGALYLGKNLSSIKEEKTVLLGHTNTLDKDNKSKAETKTRTEKTVKMTSNIKKKKAFSLTPLLYVFIFLGIFSLAGIFFSLLSYSDKNQIQTNNEKDKNEKTITKASIPEDSYQYLSADESERMNVAIIKDSKENAYLNIFYENANLKTSSRGLFLWNEEGQTFVPIKGYDDNNSPLFYSPFSSVPTEENYYIDYDSTIPAVSVESKENGEILATSLTLEDKTISLDLHKEKVLGTPTIYLATKKYFKQKKHSVIDPNLTYDFPVAVFSSDIFDEAYMFSVYQGNINMYTIIVTTYTYTSPGEAYIYSSDEYTYYLSHLIGTSEPEPLEHFFIGDYWDISEDEEIY